MAKQAKRKYKPMTKREKQWNKEIRAEMREQGIIPPVKPKLNRKKFLQETFQEWKTCEKYASFPYIIEAIYWMVSANQERNITQEQVGVLKMMRIAIALGKFYEEKAATGETTYKVTEQYEQVIKPIKEL